MGDSPQNSFKELFSGTKGTILFWALVLVAVVFLLKILPNLLSMAWQVAVFGVIAYFLIKVLGKR